MTNAQVSRNKLPMHKLALWSILKADDSQSEGPGFDSLESLDILKYTDLVGQQHKKIGAEDLTIIHT